MKNRYVELLERLIATPSLSGKEDATADIIVEFLSQSSVDNVHRGGNNVWAYNRYFSAQKPTILLNSHHDTVSPSVAYTRDPFAPMVEDGRLYGLGSNDAGGSVVALTAAFLYFYAQQDLPFNLCLALVAEEEHSGTGGLRSVLDQLGAIDFAIVGEPTQMKMAVAERGLMVLDCVAHGRSGHAARGEGLNAIYIAMQDIAWAATYQFGRLSPLFGGVKMTTTIVKAGSAHNVVPSECAFTVDVRVSEQYTLEEVLATVRENFTSIVEPRSLNLRPSSIGMDHQIVEIGLAMGVEYYGSPTTSDAAVLSPIPCLKMGPGDSARSHTADEWIGVDEITQGIDQYILMIDKLKTKV